MARRDDQQHHHKIQYASILPVTSHHTNHHDLHDPNRKVQDDKRMKAV